MSQKVRRALITGGAGFIGVHLGRRLLAGGWNVDLLDNFSRGVGDREFHELSSDPRVRKVECDLAGPTAEPRLKELEGASYQHIYHLAAIIGVSHVLKRPMEVLRDNVRMLSNVIDFARGLAGLERFVFSSTSEVYAGTLRHMTLPVPTPETVPLAVTDVAHPRASYMLSKIYGEAMCHHSGLPVTIVRPHNLYGPRMGMSHVIPELLKKAFQAGDGGTLEVASITHRRAFCYISDAVEMIARAAEAGRCARQTLNIGNQQAELSIGELAEAILAVTGKKLKIVAAPDTPGSPARRCPDMSTTAKLTGYESQVDLKRGLELTFEWYRRNVFSSCEVSAQ